MAVVARIAVCLLLLVAHAQLAWSCRFVVSAPNVLRVPSETDVQVLVTGSNNVDVTLSLKGLDVVGTGTVSDGDMKTVTLSLRYNNTMLLNKQDNNVTLVAKLSGGGCSETKETNVIVTFRSCIVLIQTDKPIYKPRDTSANIRFYPVSPALKPLKGAARCYIKDGEGVVIQDFRDPIEYHTNVREERIRGLVVRTFPLQRIYPRPGTYQVSCFCGQRFPMEYSTTFQIEEYVLPTFSARIVKVTPCISAGARDITVTLRAEYTFGTRILEGNVFVKVGVVDRPEIPEVVSLRNPLGQVRPGGGDQEDHSIIVPLPLGNEDIHPEPGDRLYVKAYVSESGSDRLAEDIWTGTLFAEEAILPHLEVSRYFPPGEVVQYLACSRRCTGVPVSGVIVDVTISADGNNLEPGTGITHMDTNGCVLLAFTAPRGSSQITLVARIRDGQSTDTKVTTATSLCSGAPAYLSRQDGYATTSIGKVMVLHLRVSSFGENQANIIFQVIAQGKTVQTTKYTRTLDAPVVFEFTVTREMSPKITVIAYAYAVSGPGCAVTSITILVTFALPNSASLAVVNQNGGSNTIRVTNKNYENLFQGQAPPGSTVRFLAVDEALMTLKREARLPDGISMEQIEKYVKAFSPVCGDGGGSNTASVFMNSGVSLLSNTGLSDSSRFHLGCQASADASRRRRRRSVDHEICPRRQCYPKYCQQLSEALVKENCSKNEYQTADGSCERHTERKQAFRCDETGCFDSQACNTSHCWCLNAIGGVIPGTMQEGERSCHEYRLCRSMSISEPPEGCEIECGSYGFQRGVDGCPVCRCNRDHVDIGHAWALSCQSCEDIDSAFFAPTDYKTSVLRCQCYSTVQKGAVLGRSYCCAYCARSGAGRVFNPADQLFGDGPFDKNQYGDPALVQARKNFQDSWLLDEEVVADQNGRAYLTPTSIPDSLTKYHITMSAMHPEFGFGMASDTLTVQAFLQVRTSVPYSVKVKEDFTVRCTVYNFGSSRLRVPLSLTVSSELCLTQNQGTTVVGLQDINPNSLWSHVFVVKALEVTSIAPATVTCTAQSFFLKDAEEQKVYIEPEGEEARAIINIPVDCDAKSACPPGVCHNGGTPVEGVRCCHCNCPAAFTGQNCTELVVPVADSNGVAARHSVRVTPRVVFLEVDDDLRLDCLAESIAPLQDLGDASHRWERASGRPLSSQTKLRNQVLYIHDMQLTDQDEYICHVTWEGVTVSAWSSVIIGSRCPYNGSVHDNPCALRFFKPGNPTPSLVKFERRPDEKQQISTVDLSVVGASPNSLQCRVFVRGQYQLPIPALELIEYGSLTKFIRQPGGCGEQVMVNLAPLVYVMNYLEETGRFVGHEAKRTEGRSDIHTGVQLECGHRNGKCFSVWKGGTPSIWLGAFIARTFCMAVPWQLPIETTSVISNALDCILEAQDKNEGSVHETGRVGYRFMTGGTDLSAKGPMTAYVLLTLTDCANVSNRPTAIARAVKYLKTGFEDVISNYHLALTTYAFCRAQEPKAAAGVSRLWLRASQDPSGTYWTKAANDHQHYDVSPNSLDIETTAYALLAMLCMNEETSKVLPIAEYLIQKYSPTTSSTQEIIVGIQAMVEFAKVNQEVPATNFRVDMHSAPESGAGALLGSTNVNEENYNTRQEMFVPSIIKKVRLTATGDGKGMMQVACDYRILETCDQCPFEVDVSFEEQKSSAEDEPSTLTVVVSVRWKTDHDYTDNGVMFIVHLDFFSGYELMESSKQNIQNNPDVGLVETRNQGVVIYLDKMPLPSQPKLSLRAIAKKESSFFDVHSAPAIVRVYDYYDPDKRCEKFYSRGNESSSPDSVCSAEDTSQCACVAKTCPNCSAAICQLATDFRSNWTYAENWRRRKNKPKPVLCNPVKGNKKPKPHMERLCKQHNEINRWVRELETLSCSQVDFVYKVILKAVEGAASSSSWLRLKVRVAEIYKNGSIDFPPRKVKRPTLHFYLSKTCRMCGDFFLGLTNEELAKKKAQFFIFGKDSSPLVLENGSRIMRVPHSQCFRGSGLEKFLSSLKKGRLCN